MPPPNLPTLLQQIQYPGMTFVESRIAQAWLEAHGEEWDQIAFNVRLGEGVPQPEDVDEETRRLGKLLTQKRADMIASRSDQVAIIEVKVRVAPIALGELLVYRDLFVQADPIRRVVRMIAIGRALVPDMGDCLTRYGVECELFPRVTPETVSI